MTEPGSWEYEQEIVVDTKQQATHNDDVAEYFNGFPVGANTQCDVEHQLRI